MKPKFMYAPAKVVADVCLFVVKLIYPKVARTVVMVDVAAMPEGAFGYVPTPALVAPMEFTMSAETYAASGGHLDRVVALAEVIEAYGESARVEPWRPQNPWPFR